MKRFVLAGTLLIGLFLQCTVCLSAEEVKGLPTKLPDKLGNLTDLKKLKDDKNLSRLQRTDILISWFIKEKDNPSKPTKGWGGGEITSGYTQAQILRALANSGDPVWFNRKVQEDKLDAYTKDSLCITLGLMGDERQAGKLQDILLNHKEAYLRELAAIALGDLGVAEAIPALEKALKDEYTAIFGSCIGGVTRTAYPVRESAALSIQALQASELVKAAKERNKIFADRIKAAKSGDKKDP